VREKKVKVFMSEVKREEKSLLPKKTNFFSYFVPFYYRLSLCFAHTHTRAHTQTHAHTHTHKVVCLPQSPFASHPILPRLHSFLFFYFYISLSLTHTRTHFLSLSLSLTHTHKQTLSFSLSLPSSLAIPLYLKHTFFLTLSLSIPLSLSLSHSLSLLVAHYKKFAAGVAFSFLRDYLRLFAGSKQAAEE